MTTHQPRKRFGQNFLHDKNIIEKIVHALHAQADDNLVEIGAGTGALTAELVTRIKHLNVIEIDRDLSALLKENYSPQKLTVYEQDALRFDFSLLCDENKPPLRVFGNLPYNISTPILFHLLTYAELIDDMLFMLQKEVIVRMSATPNHHEYGRLSVMIQYACEVKMLFDIGPEAFHPRPKVMSSLVYLKPYSNHNRPHPLANNFKTFFNVVNVAFQQRRKTLRNALKSLVSVEIFEALGIDPIRRPETLTVSEFVNLSNALVPNI